jgi:hypothetical protein
MAAHGFHILQRFKVGHVGLPIERRLKEKDKAGRKRMQRLKLINKGCLKYCVPTTLNKFQEGFSVLGQTIIEILPNVQTIQVHSHNSCFRGDDLRTKTDRIN